MFHCLMTLIRFCPLCVQRSVSQYYFAESGTVKGIVRKAVGEAYMGNCDEFLYLSGNEQGTHKYVSELLSEQRLTRTPMESQQGHSGNYSAIIRIQGGS